MRAAKKAVQAGFTLVELIVVIVILGILAAVAIPKFSNTSDNAYYAVQDATLGALKSAWAIAYATNKANPTVTQVAASMNDPSCNATSAGTITCAGVYVHNTTTLAEFGTGASADSAVIDSPAKLVAPTTR